MAEHFRLMDLPLEIRQHVYSQYLTKCSRLSDHEIYGKELEPQSEAPLLHVSKQVFEEVTQIIRLERSCRLVVTDDGIMLECPQRSSFKGLDGKIDYSLIKHLEIAVYPKIALTRSDATYTLLSYLLILISKLQLVTLQHLSVVLHDKWFGQWAESDTTPTIDNVSLGFTAIVLELFLFLSNVVRLDIFLPKIMRRKRDLQRFRGLIQNVVTYRMQSVVLPICVWKNDEFSSLFGYQTSSNEKTGSPSAIITGEPEWLKINRPHYRVLL